MTDKSEDVLPPQAHAENCNTNRLIPLSGDDCNCFISRWKAQIIAQAKAEGRRAGLLEAAELLDEGAGQINGRHTAATWLRALAEGKG